jgi:hypothetical protein
MQSPSLPEAIRQFLDHKLDGLHLRYRLMTHPTWCVPIAQAPDEVLADPTGHVKLLALEDEGGQRHFNVFSSPEALQHTQAVRGDHAVGQAYITLAGWQLFTFRGQEFAYLNIDPDEPHAIHFKQHQFDGLNQWARMVGLDATLHRLQAQAEVPETDIQTLLDYEHYYLALTEHPDGARIALAPDSQNRTLGAVFTSEMAAQTYADWLEEGYRLGGGTPPPLRIIQITGRPLWKELASMAELQGIVFNCRGPITPRAFSLKIATFLVAEAMGDAADPNAQGSEC